MISNGEMILRLVLSVVLGSLIGIERERLNWAAGLRTHMIVCMGASLIMLVSAYGFQDIIHAEHITLDPSRIAAQVVSGIGFLGAGTILIRQSAILGLTTAASLWGVAAIGLAVGGGLYVPASAATILMLLVLAGIKPLERFFFERRKQKVLTIHTTHNNALSKTLVNKMKKKNIDWLSLENRRNTDDQNAIQLVLTENKDDKELQKLIAKFRKIEGVEKILVNNKPVKG